MEFRRQEAVGPLLYFLDELATCSLAAIALKLPHVDVLLPAGILKNILLRQYISYNIFSSSQLLSMLQFTVIMIPSIHDGPKFDVC